MNNLFLKLNKNIVEDIVKNIKFFKIIDEEEYILKKQKKNILNNSYQKLFLEKVIEVTKNDKYYSITEIAYFLLKEKNIKKKSLFLFLNETNTEFIFYFIPLTDIFNQSLKNKLIIKKDEYEQFDIRFQYSILYYQYKLESNLTYILSNNYNNKYLRNLENKEKINIKTLFKIYYKIKIYNKNLNKELISKKLPWFIILVITFFIIFINISEINNNKEEKFLKLKNEINILEKEKKRISFSKNKINHIIKNNMEIKK